MSGTNDDSGTNDRDDGAAARARAEDEPRGRTADGPRELLLMEAGGRRFAVFAEEVDCEAEGLVPTPLPHAPAPVVGVVCARGRMRTVLDAAALLAREETGERAGEGGGRNSAGRLFVALRGYEQLALAAERTERVTLPAGEIHFHESPRGVARGTFTKDSLTVFLLDPSRLFEAAVRGAERRRRR